MNATEKRRAKRFPMRLPVAIKVEPAKNAKQAKELLIPAVRLVDRAGRRGVIKHHTASRTVGRLTVAVNGIAAK